MMGGHPRAAVGVALLAAATMALSGCTGRSATHKAAGTHSPSGAVAAEATRWWSNSAVKVGSSIDPSRPQAAVARLHPSRTDYCTMLRETVSAGRSVLPGVGAADPSLLVATKAFVAELQRVAPAPVAPSWQVLGDVVVKLVASGGDIRNVRVDAAAVQRAGTTVAAHAKSTCHVNVSAARP